MVDFGEMAKFRDVAGAQARHDAALAMAIGHVIFKEFHLEQPSRSFRIRRLTDMPMLVTLKQDGSRYVPEYFLRACS